MTAPNHAITGAIIGLSLAGSPLFALAAAFLSHFVLDAVPHYDPPGDELTRLSSRRFLRELYAHFALCVLVVGLLAVSGHRGWLLAAGCAFAATAPDLFWIPKFMLVKRSHRLPTRQNAFLRFHQAVQWHTSPRLWWWEAAWFAATGAVLLVML